MTDKPIRKARRSAPARGSGLDAAARGGQLYRRLPGGNHGLDPETVRVDQARRLRRAMVELIAAKGYPAVRISDLSRLAHVSPPTLYSLYADKEELFIDAYEEISRRATETIAASQSAAGPPERRLEAALADFFELASREPQEISLLVLGAFGAGPGAMRRRRRLLEGLEAFVDSTREPPGPRELGDMIVRALLGGIREVTANRLRAGREAELPGLATQLAAWARLYPTRLPEGLAARLPEPASAAPVPASERAVRAGGRLPSGRSDLPRELIVKRQRERIVDATAAIVAEGGLQALTVPEIARRANVSNQTFYALYRSKHEAFLGAQKVGMHQALRITVDAAVPSGGPAEDWPAAVATGVQVLLGYLASEPAHAHLTLVDTFAASPQALVARDAGLSAFVARLRPGFEMAPEGQAPEVTGEAIVGGIWQVLHHYAEAGCAHALPSLAPQITYFTLTPFLGAERAAEVARTHGAEPAPRVAPAGAPA